MANDSSRAIKSNGTDSRRQFERWSLFKGKSRDSWSTNSAGQTIDFNDSSHREFSAGLINGLGIRVASHECERATIVSWLPTGNATRIVDWKLCNFDSFRLVNAHSTLSCSLISSPLKNKDFFYSLLRYCNIILLLWIFFLWAIDVRYAEYEYIVLYLSHCQLRYYIFFFIF